jgi:hypothetical protein
MNTDNITTNNNRTVETVKEYLTRHKLENYLNPMINQIVQERTETPLQRLSELMGQLLHEQEEKTQGPDDETKVDTELSNLNLQELTTVPI